MMKSLVSFTYRCATTSLATATFETLLVQSVTRFVELIVTPIGVLGKHDLLHRTDTDGAGHVVLSSAIVMVLKRLPVARDEPLEV
jgi:hypothetical protein